LSVIDEVVRIESWIALEIGSWQSMEISVTYFDEVADGMAKLNQSEARITLFM